MSAKTMACRSCGLVQDVGFLDDGMVAECSRCGLRLAKGRRNSIGRTAAFSLSALLLYVPANVYPILRMDFHGLFTQNTVWDGCARLFQEGQWLVAVIVFMASLMIPLLKLIGLFFLVITTKLKSPHLRKVRTRIHRIIEIAGPWAMLDVFLLAILVALVKLGRVATVTPGPGLLAFASVVVLTILASASFDPAQIWEESREDE